VLVSTTTNPPATSDPVRLHPGRHTAASGQLCLLEAAAVLAGEPLTDHPRRVSPIVSTLGIRLNDLATHRQRQTLTRFLPDLVGTADDGKEDARRWVALDFSVRTVWPRCVDRFGMREEAAVLRGLAPITGEPAYSAARPLVAPIIDELTRLRRRRRDGSSAVLGSSVVVDRVGLVDAAAVAIAQASDRGRGRRPDQPVCAHRSRSTAGADVGRRRRTVRPDRRPHPPTARVHRARAAHIIAMSTQDVALTITTDQIHSWGLVGIVLIVLAAGLVITLIKSVVGRTVGTVLALVLIGVLWQQRGNITDSFRSCDPSILGLHLQVSDPAQRAACTDVFTKTPVAVPGVPHT
jgi:hypothetical protein